MKYTVYCSAEYVHKSKVQVGFRGFFRFNIVAFMRFIVQI
jgi:hypothetical protein